MSKQERIESILIKRLGLTRDGTGLERANMLIRIAEQIVSANGDCYHAGIGCIKCPLSLTLEACGRDESLICQRAKSFIKEAKGANND